MFMSGAVGGTSAAQEKCAANDSKEREREVKRVRPG